MFSNEGDAPRKAPVNPNRQNAEAGMFSNSSDGPDASSYGGGQRGQGMGPRDPNISDDGGRTGGVSAGYDNNMEGTGEGGEGKKKHGILGKIKEAFVPKPGAIGRTGNEDLVS